MVPLSLGPDFGEESEDQGLCPCSATVWPRTSHFSSLCCFQKWLNVSQVVLVLGLSCYLTPAPAQRKLFGTIWRALILESKQRIQILTLIYS